MDVLVCESHTYSHAFDEVAETIRYGLDRLAATGFALPDRQIVVGAHLLPPDTRPDKRRILYNFEQRDSPQLSASVLDLFRRHELWDYSISNVQWLSRRGVSARYVPLGYVPELTRIKWAPSEDIDVLFYGLVNDRRRKILDGLRAAGLTVVDAFAVYGKARDQLIGRSKVVLNMHFYDARIFEIVRCSYLFANRVCVVSEESEDVPLELRDAVHFAPYAGLVDACVRQTRAPMVRDIAAARAHEAFRQCDEVEYLRRALQ